jgi:hypothetical protein
LKEYSRYWKEIVTSFVGVGIALSFYFLTKESVLSIAIGILLAGFSVQAALIKSNVEEALKSNLESYNLQASIDHPLFKIRAQRIMEVCLRDLRSLIIKTYEVYGPEPAFLETMGFYERAHANDIIRSVLIYEKDMTIDGIYLKLHKEAVKRGVIIIKIFIVPDEETNGYHDKIQKFDDVGVKNYLVRQKTIGSDSRLFADFLLYKDIVAISTIGYKGLLIA